MAGGALELVVFPGVAAAGALGVGFGDGVGAVLPSWSKMIFGGSLKGILESLFGGGGKLGAGGLLTGTV